MTTANETTIDAKAVADLRKVTGAGLMKCKEALREAGGDPEKAVEYLRKKGILSADKRLGRATTQGGVGAYLHTSGKLGVMLELLCETDFVARTDEYKQLLKDLCMHIAGTPIRPVAVDREGVDPALLAKERELLLNSDEVLKKPENMREKIVEGKLQRFYVERVLLDQPFVKNDKITVGDRIKETMAKLGENITVGRYTVIEVGK